MTATDELRPCPFCGGTEQRVKSSGRWGWFVSCSCCAVGPSAKSREEAVDAWNHRIDEKIHCRDCRYYVRDKMPIDPGWPMMCYESGRDMLEPWGWCAWAERKVDA